VNDESASHSTAASPLSQDTLADKAVRFGCGAGLAVLVFLILVLSGVGEPFGVSGVVAAGIVLVGASGVLSVLHGDRFIERLLKFIKWLA
jgi:hypothetical protein